jgi:hypothetical protein
MKLPQTWVIKPTTVSSHHSSPVKHFFLWWVWAAKKFHFSHKNQLFDVVWSYAIEELSILATWKRETNLNSCENIEKQICGPGFPKSAVQKILHHPTLSGERSNWISTFYSGVDTNAFISSPIIFSSKFPSLISSTRRLDHSLTPTHIPLFWFEKTKSFHFCIQFVKNNASKGEFQNFFKEATAYAGLALIPTLYRFFKNTITAWLIFKY